MHVVSSHPSSSRLRRDAAQGRFFEPFSSFFEPFFLLQEPFFLLQAFLHVSSSFTDMPATNQANERPCVCDRGYQVCILFLI